MRCSARGPPSSHCLIGPKLHPSGVAHPSGTTRLKSIRALKPIDGYTLITPGDLHWRPSNLMKIPNADFLERTQSELLSARLWRLPPRSANTLHRHLRAEEFYF